RNPGTWANAHQSVSIANATNGDANQFKPHRNPQWRGPRDIPQYRREVGSQPPANFARTVDNRASQLITCRPTSRRVRRTRVQTVHSTTAPMWLRLARYILKEGHPCLLHLSQVNQPDWSTVTVVRAMRIGSRFGSARRLPSTQTRTRCRF